jgi:hypothetical protein
LAEVNINWFTLNGSLDKRLCFKLPLDIKYIIVNN